MKNTASALPRRVQELKPSSQSAHKNRSSSKHGVHKRSKKHSKSAARDKAKSPGRYERKLVREADNEESFHRETSICTALCSLPQLRLNVPWLVRTDPSTLTYVTRVPGIISPPFYGRAKTANISQIKLWTLKQDLRGYIDLLYEHGVGYRISPYHILLIDIRDYPGWQLYLSDVVHSDFCEVSKRSEPAWDAQKKEQYAEIDRMFAPVEGLIIQKGADAAIKLAAERTAKADAALKVANAAMDKADATVKEVDATIKEASAAMKKAYDTLMEACATIKEANALMSEAEDDWDAAHYTKATMLESTRQANFHKAKAVIVIKEADAAMGEACKPGGDAAMKNSDACQPGGRRCHGRSGFCKRRLSSFAEHNPGLRHLSVD